MESQYRFPQAHIRKRQISITDISYRCIWGRVLKTSMAPGRTLAGSLPSSALPPGHFPGDRNRSSDLGSGAGAPRSQLSQLVYPFALSYKATCLAFI